MSDFELYKAIIQLQGEVQGIIDVLVEKGLVKAEQEKKIEGEKKQEKQKDDEVESLT